MRPRRLSEIAAGDLVDHPGSNPHQPRLPYGEKKGEDAFPPHRSSRAARVTSLEPSSLGIPPDAGEVGIFLRLDGDSTGGRLWRIVPGLLWALEIPFVAPHCAGPSYRYRCEFNPALQSHDTPAQDAVYSYASKHDQARS